MAARKHRRPEASREEILAAAASVILERGHADISLREIARRCGFSPAGLYEYFDGKDAIVSAVAERIERELRARLDDARRGADTPRRGLRALLMAYVGFARERPEEFQLLYSQLSQPRRTPEDPVAQSSPWSVVLEAIEACVESGSMSPPPEVPLEAVGYGLWALAHGAAMLQITYLRDFDAPWEVLDEGHFGALIRSLS